MSAKCGSCDASIVWAKTENQKPIPIDHLPVQNGNIDLVADADPREPPTAYVLDKLGFRDLGDGTKHSPFLRYVSHFATCPQSRAWRKA